MNQVDTYRTIIEPSGEVIFKDKGSKFLGYAYPLKSEDEVKPIVQYLKTQHHKARHWCYAWQIGTDEVKYRVNDDGEPNNSAGQPIYGQILSKDLTHVLVVVVRYFGGTKLGVGGLVNAYKSAAQLALDFSKIAVKTINTEFVLIFEYSQMNVVMRIVKESNSAILDKKMELNCEFIISIRRRDAKKLQSALEGARFIKWKLI